jgi:transcription initiation factor TFIIIB Brf1 subunit/transcription initiation factor TFIIB
MIGRGVKDESQRRRLQSQTVRAEAMRTRIMAAHTFCGVAERQARWESVDAARRTLSTAWHTVEEIERHIREPNHIDEKAAATLRELLVQLEERARRIEGELDRLP